MVDQLTSDDFTTSIYTNFYLPVWSGNISEYDLLIYFMILNLFKIITALFLAVF